MTVSGHRAHHRSNRQDELCSFGIDASLGPNWPVLEWHPLLQEVLAVSILASPRTVDPETTAAHGGSAIPSYRYYVRSLAWRGVTMLTPTTARAFWAALLENAARIIVDADNLFPSPRAQSLVVLAQEEVGKAVWVQNAFRKAWSDGDESPRDVPELREQGFRHLAKLIAASDFSTLAVEVPGYTEPVEIELVKAHAPHVLDAYLTGLARQDNEAKKNGFYVDLHADGSFTVPHEIDIPLLRSQIWEAADMVKWCVDEDHLWGSTSGRRSPSPAHVEGLLASVLARGPDV